VYLREFHVRVVEMRTLLLMGVFVIVMTFAVPHHAEAAGGKAETPETGAAKAGENALSDQKGKEQPEEKPSTTRHAIKIRGKTFEYTATASTLQVNDDSGKPEAHVFFVAYSREEKNGANRPITFAFNGGPGASSVWLHLGALGPKRVVLAGDGKAFPSSYELMDNDQTWLDFTDLVFVDPVGTGYSRAAAGVDAGKFYSVNGDISAAGEFIRLYITKFGRWLSPKFLVGESYGTTRAAGLVNYLQSEKGINFNGIILLSSVLDFQTISFNQGNDLPYVLSLPSFAAAAWHHRKLSPDLQSDLQKTLAGAEQWAMSEYLTALAKGSEITDAERAGIAGKLVAYTGLSREVIEESNLRVSTYRFARELLKEERHVVGIMDSRVKGFTLPPYGDHERPDPAFFLVTGPYVATLNDYLRKGLGYESSLPYEFLSMEVNRAWKWGSASGGYLDVSDDLAEAVTMNPNLRVFMGAGYYDLTTPYRSQRFTFDHLALDEHLRYNIIFKCYDSGHQIYTVPEELKKLTDEVKAFVEESLQKK
jgi:carboxypeptidase C (cathepsin A)